MSRKYYEKTSTGAKYTTYNTISNGIILTKFCEKTGTPYGNSEYQFFVTKFDLDKDFKPFEFKLETSEAMNRIIASHLHEIVLQMNNYGIAEDQTRNFKEFYHHSPTSLDIYRDMVKDDKLEFGDYLSETDRDDYYYSEAEDFFPFLHLGLVPILKKMLIELNGEAQ